MERWERCLDCRPPVAPLSPAAQRAVLTVLCPALAARAVARRGVRWQARYTGAPPTASPRPSRVGRVRAASVARGGAGWRVVAIDRACRCCAGERRRRRRRARAGTHSAARCTRALLTLWRGGAHSQRARSGGRCCRGGRVPVRNHGGRRLFEPAEPRAPAAGEGEEAEDLRRADQGSCPGRKRQGRYVAAPNPSSQACAAQACAPIP